MGRSNSLSFFHRQRAQAAKYIECDLCCVTKIKIDLLDSETFDRGMFSISVS